MSGLPMSGLSDFASNNRDLRLGMVSAYRISGMYPCTKGKGDSRCNQQRGEVELKL